MRPRENMSQDPTCSGDDGVTELQEQILILLEMEGISDSVNQRIMKLVAEGEEELREEELAEHTRESRRQDDEFLEATAGIDRWEAGDPGFYDD